MLAEMDPSDESVGYAALPHRVVFGTGGSGFGTGSPSDG
jgi:hypothetical protein